MRLTEEENNGEQIGVCVDEVMWDTELFVFFFFKQKTAYEITT